MLRFTGFQRYQGRVLAMGITLTLGVAAWLFGNVTSAEAAEKVVLTYGGFGRSITLEELEDFVQTGRTTPTLRFLINATKQDPNTVRDFLQRDVKVSAKLLDNVLNILPGEYVLFQAGQIFHTPARLSNDKALRSSIILSTVDDGQLSVLEFLRKYPTREFYIDGYRLAGTAGDVVQFVNQVGDELEGPLAIATDLLDGLVCDCQTDLNR